MMSLLILLCLIGTPLFAIIAASAMIGYQAEGIDLMALVIEILGLANMPFLSAIPLFTVSGYLLSESGAPKRLVRLTNAMLGWMPCGLAIVSLFACAFFTAFTGASGVTIIAIGAILYPALKTDGYSDKFSLGLITTSGSLGLLFAPSLPLILYGVIAEVSIDDLFKAGLLPGMLMLLMLSLYCLWVGRHSDREIKPFNFDELIQALRESAWELPLPIIVLGGIYSGFFAVSEAAAITALYVICIEVFLLKEIKIADLPRLMRESMLLVGGILIVLAVSLASTNYMIDSGIPQQLFFTISSIITDQFTFLALLLLFLLILGAILDIFAAIVLVVPLLLPVASQYGIDPIHLGIIFLSAMQLGYLTPPVGLNLFIASYRFDKSIATVYAATLPFFAILFVSVVFITYWPELTLFFL
ncbi:MAG: TRAP transporter large permease [Woeseiaceae bacterium]|jgi:C4-dicarboxylate transporter DctM subunit|tara:strand:- start:287 stop:1531 length:1245 start_codon:yes stop_codon:yes gene_type:complete